MEVERQALQAGVELGAQVEQRPQADPGQEVPVGDAEEAVEQVDHDHAARRPGDRLGDRQLVAQEEDRVVGRGGGEQGVDHPLDRPRHEQAHPGRGEQEHQRHRDLRQVGAEGPDDAGVDRHRSA